jgi:hypothetical protein
MQACRNHIAGCLLCSLSLLAVSPCRAADDEVKAKAAEVKQTDISKLPNDDLLKQASAILAKGTGDYLAAVRALAGVDAQLSDASKQLAELTPSTGEPRTDGDSQRNETVKEDAARAGVDAAKGKADFARRRLKLAHTREQLEGRVAAAAEGLQSAAIAYQTALEDLKPFSVEIALRFEDGTLSGARPAGLLPDSLESKRKVLAAEHDGIKYRLSEARRSIEATAKALDEAEKAVSTADAEVTEAGRVYAREQQRKRPKRDMPARTPTRCSRSSIDLCKTASA